MKSSYQLSGIVAVLYAQNCISLLQNHGGGRYYSCPHFTDEETERLRRGNLPKVSQLTDGSEP